MAKTQTAKNGKTVYALFRCGLYYDGGDELKSLHTTRAGAKDARDKHIAARQYAGLGFEIKRVKIGD